MPRRGSAGPAERLLFAVAALAAEMGRELIRERTLDGVRAVAAGPRPSPPAGSTSSGPAASR
ncbi:hypothetical protein ACPCHT_37260 [Nucisporomicrobium flavum]|uniref:hypothetical protein n=1 Tax=Nucisporomicrobium flavum TaxID=2785915 RepID=UPI003C2E3C5E